jgi:hypothetical protein
MRFDMLLLKRFLGKLVHDILPAALASLLGGFMITYFQLNRAPEPVTVPVAHASPEMMQLLRDEHGLIVNFVNAQVASEKTANEKMLGARADEAAPRAPAEERAAPASTAPQPTMIVALAPVKPASTHGKNSVVGASLAQPTMAPVQQSAAQQSAAQQSAAQQSTAQPSESAPPAARNDDSWLAKTIGIKEYVIVGTQRAVSAIGVIPSWFGSIGDRIGGEDPNPRPPAHLVSEF